jgi:triphosphoribosyl-dephospho-CoA synthase CitG
MKRILYFLNNHICLQSEEERINEIGSIVLRSILLELSCTPKPGLVDRFNPGANQDMDFNTFILSTSSLVSGFYQMIRLGMNFSGESGKLLSELRKIGRVMEKRMLEATGGINTQKGLIFLEGLICISAGILDKTRENLSPENICQKVKEVCNGIVSKELKILYQHSKFERLTHGEILFLKYGITGVRGEVERGFPTVREKGLPALRKGLKEGLSFNDASVQALLNIMTISEDTNVIFRSDLEFLKEKVQLKAKKIIDMGGMYTDKGRKNIHDLDQFFIEKGINPGGSADLLAVTITLQFLSLLSAK